MLRYIVSRLTKSIDSTVQQEPRLPTRSIDTTVEFRIQSKLLIEEEDMSLTVKAFLLKSGSGSKDFEEIRRIPVPLNNVEDFQFLVQKIKSAFPSLADKTIQLSYRDFDNDVIAFSSDEELREALKTEADGVFKVYVETKGGETPKENSGCGGGGVLHPCVTCDGCEGEVRGIRYKCSVCPNYDLCQTCKDLGLHPEHQMTEIKTPVARPFFPPPFGTGAPPPFCFPQPGGPGMPPFFHGGPGSRDEMRMQRRAWRRWMKAMCGADPCKGWKREKKDEKHEEKKARKAEKKARKEKERAEKAESAEQAGTQKSNDKDSSSSSSSSDEGESSPTGDYLKSVGQSVAAMLDPLGIDVEIDVEHKGKRKHCQRGFPRGPWGMHMRGGCGGPGWGGRGGAGGRGGFWHMGGPFGRCGASAHASAAAYGAPPHGQYPHHPPPPPPPHAPYPHPPPQYPHDVDTNSETGELRSGVQTPGCCVFTDPFSKNGETDKNATISVSAEPNGWTLVVETDGVDVEGAAKGVENLKMAGQDNGGGTDQPQSMDEKMIDALDKMMSMGYTDSDGWLTALLVDNNLDIGRTLDAIMNTKK